MTKNLSIDFAVTNVFDKMYDLPLGGINVVDYTASTYTSVAGIGRSANVALTYKF
jgi:outer membrane receptor protein involved in Fe transport